MFSSNFFNGRGGLAETRQQVKRDYALAPQGLSRGALI
jgi:hypothetical protein